MNIRKLFDGKHLLISLSVLILSIIITIGALVYGDISLRLSPYRAEVSMVSGNVEKSEKAGQWVELQNDDSVKQGVLVRVNGVGKAVITLDDGSAIRIGDNSRIRLSSLDPKNIEIINEQGEVYTRVVKADRSFAVKVGDESYKSLGTAYKTTNLDSEKGVYVYESTVKALSKDIEISAGKKYFEDNISKDLVAKVVDISSDDINKDDFVQWNKEQDLSSDEFKEYMGVLEESKEKVASKTTTKEKAETTEITKNTNNTVEQVTPAISLSVETTSSGVILKWSKAGVDVSNGFKLVKSTSKNPVYPGDSYVYLGAEARSYTWKITDGKTYHFRVCQYTGSGCGLYSNDISATVPFVDISSVNSIVLTAGVVGAINWTVDGHSDQGFKIVWSKTAGPTYPKRDGDQYYYSSSSETRTYTVTAFDGDGDYYVRVCEYLGGKCGKYSNEIIVSLVE
ncbi:MAG: FecR domain-containing protein [Candidatus Saccharimonadales bacterium]